MPRNKRKVYYSRKFDLRFSQAMAARMEGLAHRRQAKIAHIVRMATEVGLRKMEAAEAKEAGMAVLTEGQKARISGLESPLTNANQTFEGVIMTVAKDDVSGWTYATYVGDGPYSMVVIKLDQDGKLQGDYKLEVEESKGDKTYWRDVNGAPA